MAGGDNLYRHINWKEFKLDDRFPEIKTPWDVEIIKLMDDFCLGVSKTKEVLRRTYESSKGTETNDELYKLAWRIMYRAYM